MRRAVGAVAVVLLLAAGCSSTDEPPPAAKTSPTPSGPTALTFGVYGPAQVVSAYTKIAADYSADHPDTVVNIKAYASHEDALAAVRGDGAAGEVPDLFLIDRDDLAGLTAAKAVRRIDDLLGQRQVDFGDGYIRNGLEAFSADSALQCMPADVSPMVVYYNPRLIDLAQVAEPGENPVTPEDGWSLEEFTRAALQARRPGVRGVYIAPELEQLAPFIWSEGGELVDESNDPTTLTLAEGSAADAMEQLLEVVRNPALTFSQGALRRQSAMDRFKAGKLGMILGYRDLTPELRAQQNLLFDVMPMPRLSTGATLGKMSGLCISAESEHIEQTADFLTYVVSDEGAEALAATGFVMPANVGVVNSETFRQTDQRPVHADVFANEVRDLRALPYSENWAAVRAATGVLLTELFYQPVILPLAERLQTIDEASKPIFDPAAAAEVSPTESVSPTPSP